MYLRRPGHSIGPSMHIEHRQMLFGKVALRHCRAQLSDIEAAFAWLEVQRARRMMEQGSQRGHSNPPVDLRVGEWTARL